MALWRGLFPALLVLLLECVLTPAIGREVRYFQADSRYAYRTHLLQLILEKSRDEGHSPCNLSIRMSLRIGG